MAKVKQSYVCQSCGSQHSKWAGQCGDCQEWNSLEEEAQSMRSKLNARQQGYAGENASKPVSLEQIPCHKEIRIDTCMTELNRVLGGGLVDGSVVLLGGDPGIGKSTLLLEALCRLSQKEKVLYVTGEESLQQVSLRANRLKLETGNIQLLADTHVERILEQLTKVAPKAAVIDSIQTLFSHDISSAPGSVSQVRESAAKLVAFAKQNSIALFLVGHVTKDGALAGPRVLEHMVDCVLYFEGGQSNRFRILRAIKNRFGAVNEIGVFAMTDKGLAQVSNPSAIFLAGYQQPKPGSVIMSSWEGTRPLLVELQALVDVSHGPNPRRVCVGLDNNRLAMLLAVLHKHCGVASYDQDVYLNVVGGLKVSETAADLAILLAVISSLRNKAIAREVMIFGEIGLSGEVRPVQAGSERINEAEKQGFKTAIVPKANCPKSYSGKMRLILVGHLSEAVSALADVLESVVAPS